MSTKSQTNNAAHAGDILDAYLSISRIYFAGAERLTILALETTRSAVEDCFAAARLAAVADGNIDAKTWQTALGQPVVERARACANSTYEILAGTQAELVRAMGSQMAFPAMRFPLSADWMSAVNRFSQGVRDLSAMGAANIAAATENVSELAARADLHAKKAA
ncbi:MAG TPA: TIGR01841 family phasin [Azospira sp.]|nr:TIGR01841 family phasin [Azospira sp.]